MLQGLTNAVLLLMLLQYATFHNALHQHTPAVANPDAKGIHDCSYIYAESLCSCLSTVTLTQGNCPNAASGKAAQRTQGRKRKQVLISDDEESPGEESSPDSGSDWSQTGKKDAASPDGDDDDDDDVSMADEEEEYPTSSSKPKSSIKRHKTSNVPKVCPSCVREPTAIYKCVQALLHHQ